MRSARSSTPEASGLLESGMASAGPSSPEPDNAPDAADEPHERFGPLSLQRLVKDDGRALLLYTRTAHPDGDQASSLSASSLSPTEGPVDPGARQRPTEDPATRL